MGGLWMGLAIPTVLCLILVACGRGNDRTTPAGSTLPDGNATAGRRSSAASEPRATGIAGSSLTRGLLRFEDMPGGWRLNAESMSSPENTEICGANLAALEQHRQKLGEAAISFERSQSGPYLAETLAAYPPGLAERVMVDLKAAVQSCTEVIIRDDEGSLSTWQLTPVSFPQFGDETLAFREYWPANNVEALVVYIRHGDRIAVLLHIAINGRVDRLQTEVFVSRAYERFAQLMTGR